MKRVAAMLVAAMPMLPASAGAAAPPSSHGSSLVDDVEACRDIPDQATRVACYDRSVDRLRAERHEGNVVVMDREDVQKTRRSLFGFDVHALPVFGDSARAPHAKPDAVTEITAQIRGVRQTGYSTFSLMLDSGGTWETTEAPQTIPSAGDPIRIKRGPLGGYLANIRGTRAVRVRRIG